LLKKKKEEKKIPMFTDKKKKVDYVVQAKKQVI